MEEMNLSPELDRITEKGILQSSLLGKHLKDVEFTQAFTSSYSRAQDTAAAIIKELATPKPELIVDDRLREREMGQFENRPMKQVFDALFTAAKEQGTKMLDFEVPGGESVKNLDARIESFLEVFFRKICSLNYKKGNLNRILIAVHFGCNPCK